MVAQISEIQIAKDPAVQRYSKNFSLIVIKKNG